jgi:hypothetical protein
MYRLTARARAAGRGWAPITPSPGWPNPANAGRDRWVILVHGYNNSLLQADKTWDRTMNHLWEMCVDTGPVVQFFWPGDYSWSRIASALLYSKTIKIAERTGAELAAYLQGIAASRKGPLHLSFVAHSLGALVVLEAIKELRAKRGNVIVSDVLLMAAAVPEGLCTSGQIYGASFSPTTREVVLYSLADSVLKNFFEAGQEIARSYPRDRRLAVGRTGGPGLHGTNGLHVTNRWYRATHMADYQHGDYWQEPESVIEIAEVVLKGQPGHASPCRRTTVPITSSIPEHKLPWYYQTTDDLSGLAFVVRHYGEFADVLRELNEHPA